MADTTATQALTDKQRTEIRIAMARESADAMQKLADLGNTYSNNDRRFLAEKYKARIEVAHLETLIEIRDAIRMIAHNSEMIADFGVGRRTQK